jgi:hypothetical protein
MRIAAAISALLLLLLTAVAVGVTKQETLSLISPRPIRDAIVEYEKEYRWVITYEEPRFEFPADMEDLARKARLMGKAIDANKTFRIPRTRTLSITYDRPVDADNATTRLQTVHKLLDAYSQSDGDSYELRQSASRLHIVPGQVKDISGRLQHATLILDTPISLVQEPRNGMQFLEEFCDQLSSNGAGTHVMMGTVPMNALFRHKTNVGFENLSAREALERFLDSMPYGARYSWRLLYGELPTGLGYVLNINWVPEIKPVTPSPVEKPRIRTPYLRNKGLRVVTAPNSPASSSGSKDTEQQKLK